jgi:DNA polymerase III subunit delta'
VTLIPLFGHDALRARLREARQRGRLPAALLFHGPTGLGKERLALWLAQWLLCDDEAGDEPCGHCAQCRYVEAGAHPDLQWYVPRVKLKGDPDTEDILTDMAEGIAERVGADRKEDDPQRGLWLPDDPKAGYFVDTSRAIVQRAALKPAMAARRVILISDIELMVVQAGNDAAANAFLKLLEEPPASTTILLTSSQPSALLPTIRSRCVMVRVPTLTGDAVQALLSHPAVSAALDAAEVPGPLARRVQRAAGRPGLLLGAQHGEAARHAAGVMLEAARGSAVQRYAVAFAQGNGGARGAFSDILDALAALLHDDAARLATAGQHDAARRAAAAVARVEQAKLEAYGNVTPTLITTVLLEDLAQARA